jgi:predicted dehydrogenase
MRRRGVPGLGTWFTDEELAGGGSLIDIGVHVLDLALHVLDFPEVVEVSGVTRQDFGGDDYAYLSMWGDSDDDAEFTVDDSATAFLRCADGSTVTLNVSWAANCEGRAGLQVLGTEAGADFEMYEGDLTLYETESGDPDRYLDTDVEVGEDDAPKLEVETFAAGVAAGEAPDWNTVEQGLVVQRVIDAIYRSSESGRAVRPD